MSGTVKVDREATRKSTSFAKSRSVFRLPHEDDSVRFVQRGFIYCKDVIAGASLIVLQGAARKFLAP